MYFISSRWRFSGGMYEQPYNMHWPKSYFIRESPPPFLAVDFDSEKQIGIDNFFTRNPYALLRIQIVYSANSNDPNDSILMNIVVFFFFRFNIHFRKYRIRCMAFVVFSRSLNFRFRDRQQ